MADRRSHMGFDHHNMTPADAGATLPQVIWKTQDGIVLAYGLTVPADTTAGYIPGALFFDVDSALYINTGSAESSAFKAYGTVNVTGNVTGNVDGDVTGNVTGNLDGDVTGNVTGNLDGDVTGNVTGNLDGDVTGNVTGNITSTILAGSISTAPAQAELVEICGPAATAGEGARRLVKGNDGSGVGNLYTVVSDGTDWFAVNMPVGTSGS